LLLFDKNYHNFLEFKIKLIILFFTFTLSILLSESSTLALPIPSFYQGMKYSESRKKMMDLGWQIPVINYSEQCEFMKEICNEYPEVDDCSGTGMGFCLFIFTNSKNERFYLTTAGREPLKLVNWRSE
jgi:hypothetical protein